MPFGKKKKLKKKMFIRRRCEFDNLVSKHKKVVII